MTTTMLVDWLYKQVESCHRHDLIWIPTILHSFKLLIDTKNAYAWNRQVSTEKVRRVGADSKKQQPVTYY